jgi:hypothetical protein
MDEREGEGKEGEGEEEGESLIFGIRTYIIH